MDHVSHDCIEIYHYLTGALQAQLPLEQSQDKAAISKVAVKDAGVILFCPDDFPLGGPAPAEMHELPTPLDNL